MSISESGWLKSDEINYYIDLINQILEDSEEKDKESTKIIIKDTYFCDVLSRCLKSTEELNKLCSSKHNDKLEYADKCLIPINIENAHWILICITLKSHLIFVYDSMESDYNQIDNTIPTYILNIVDKFRVFLICYGKIKNLEHFQNIPWQTIHCKYLKDQTLGRHCGTIVLKTIEIILLLQTDKMPSNICFGDIEYHAKQIEESLESNVLLTNGLFLPNIGAQWNILYCNEIDFLTQARGKGKRLLIATPPLGILKKRKTHHDKDEKDFTIEYNMKARCVLQNRISKLKGEYQSRPLFSYNDRISLDAFKLNSSKKHKLMKCTIKHTLEKCCLNKQTPFNKKDVNVILIGDGDIHIIIKTVVSSLIGLGILRIRLSLISNNITVKSFYNEQDTWLCNPLDYPPEIYEKKYGDANTQIDIGEYLFFAIKELQDEMITNEQDKVSLQITSYENVEELISDYKNGIQKNLNLVINICSIDNRESISKIMSNILIQEPDASYFINIHLNHLEKICIVEAILILDALDHDSQYNDDDDVKSGNVFISKTFEIIKANKHQINSEYPIFRDLSPRSICALLVKTSGRQRISIIVYRCID